MGTIKRALLFILFGCQTASPWALSHLPDAASSRLSYPAYDRVNGVGVVMVCGHDVVRTYLEVHAQSIPPYKGQEKEALVILRTENQVFSTIASRHAGGQKLLLALDAQTVLIDSLLRGESVDVELQGYRATLHPDQFSNNYYVAQKPPKQTPNLQLPFKL